MGGQVVTATAEAGVYGDEEAPKVPTAEGSGSDKRSRSCPQCAMEFPGGFGAARLARHLRSAHNADAPKDTGRERRPRTGAGKRVSVADLGTLLWKGLGSLATRTGNDAAGRMFTIQAVAAGPALDKAVKGTFVDRILQPLARMNENASEFGSLVAGPVTAQAFVNNPNPLTQALFVASLEASLPVIARSLKDVKKKQERLEADLSELGPVFGKPPGETVSLEEIATWIAFGGGDPPTAPPPQGAPEESVAA